MHKLTNNKNEASTWRRSCTTTRCHVDDPGATNFYHPGALGIVSP
jgi:hypothetical protein